MSLSYGEDGPGALAVEEVDEDMKRRALLAATTAATLDRVAHSQGDRSIKLAFPTEDPLPSRLGMCHVHEVRALTSRLVGMARYYGGQAGPFGDAVTRYTRWMRVPATDTVKAQLAAALAELHTEAGWCCHARRVDAPRWIRARGRGF
jgi:hypothetical protein